MTDHGHQHPRPESSAPDRGSGHGRGEDHGHAHGGADWDSHDHRHGTSPWAKFRRAVSDTFGGHSHDAADQVDQALEADADGRRALLISLGLLALTAVLQGAVVVFTGSVALLGDTLHNVADALTAIPLLLAFPARSAPTDQALHTTVTVAPRTWPGCS